MSTGGAVCCDVVVRSSSSWSPGLGVCSEEGEGGAAKGRGQNWMEGR